MDHSIAFTALRSAPPRHSRRTRADGATLAAHLLRQFFRPARPGFGFLTLLPPLLEDVARARVSGEFSRAVEVFSRTPETCAAPVGSPRGDTRGDAGATAGVLHIQ
jgi:hypothetical protein